MRSVSQEEGRGDSAESSCYCGKYIKAALNNRVFMSLLGVCCSTCYDLAVLDCQGYKSSLTSNNSGHFGHIKI